MSTLKGDEKRVQLRAALEDLAADMTLGGLANHQKTGDCTTSQGGAPGASSKNYSNSSVEANGKGNAAVVVGGASTVSAIYIPSSVRLQALQETTQRAVQLLSELETLEIGEDSVQRLQQTRVAVPSSAAAGDGNLLSGTAPLLAVRAWNSQKKFAELCELSLKTSSAASSSTAALSSPSSPTADAAAAAKNAFLKFNDPANVSGGGGVAAAANGSDSSAQQQQKREAALKPLVGLEAAFKELEKCKGFTYQAEIQKLQATAAAGGDGSSSVANTNAAKPQHLPALVARMSETLRELQQHWQRPENAPANSSNNKNNNNSNNNNNNRGDGRMNGSGKEAAVAMPSLVSLDTARKLFSTMSTWPQPLLRLLNEILQSPSLESVTEERKERLRRAIFDVEELAHEQEQAVTDGDMQKSEDLYYQQTELLESMNPLFDQLEYVMEQYKQTQIEAPREQLLKLQQQFTTEYQEILRREEKEQKQAQTDAENLKARLAKLKDIRGQQQAGLLLYNNEWSRLFEGNTRQQEECLKAMEQLEVRLRELANEQSFLMQDRLTKMEEERNRREAAAAFEFFADVHGAALRQTTQELAVLVDGVKQVGAAVEFSFAHGDRYLREVLLDHVNEELLSARKQRLEQFRSLYITLGDLEFKKSRHADEIAKKVEYYRLQQEIAMDALNPKAKEFSQARQKWEMVQSEIHSQLHTLEARTQRQLEDFRPTETLLLEAGVAFVHPAEELQRRNAVRQRKLLEYKEMMESRVTGADSGLSSTAADAADNRSAADILEEDMKMFAKHAPRLQSTEEGSSALNSLNATRNSRKAR